MIFFESILFPHQFLNACKVISEPEKCYSKSGILSSENQKAHRLHFNIFNVTNTRFDIQCYEEKPDSIETILTPLETGEKVYLNLNECSDRLHLSKKKINDFYEKGILNELLERKSDKLQILDEVNDHYSKLLSLYKDGVSTDMLVSKETVDLPSIKKTTLMKLIKMFHRTLKDLPLPTTFTLELKEGQKHSAYKILSHASINKSYYLIDITTQKFLAFGSYGNVFKVINLSLGTFSTKKESRLDYKEDIEEQRNNAYLDVSQEIKILNELSSLEITKNIQKPPYFWFEDVGVLKQISYVGYFYNRIDLFETMAKAKPADKLSFFANGFTELIYALDKLHEFNYFHNDIKPENIFVEIDKKGKYHLCFGDMATLRRASDNSEKFQVNEHTIVYSPFDPGFRKLTLKELKSFDVYQLGSTIYAALTGNAPYMRDFMTDEYPNFTMPFIDTILVEICSPDAILLIKKMCHRGLNFRYTTKDAIELHLAKQGFRWEK